MEHSSKLAAEDEAAIRALLNHTRLGGGSYPVQPTGC